jgi:hypothetical protein
MFATRCVKITSDVVLVSGIDLHPWTRTCSTLLFTDNGETPGRLNWWRAYQFPSVQVAHSSHTASQGGNDRTENSNSTSQRQGSRFASSLFEEAPQSRSTPAQATSENLIPVVIVGLRSLSRDSNNRSPFGSPSPPSPQSAAGTSAPAPGSAAAVDNPVRPTPADEVDAISSSYVIIVLGGHYPPEHRYASATGSDDSNELDQLWYVCHQAQVLSLTLFIGTWWSWYPSNLPRLQQKRSPNQGWCASRRLRSRKCRWQRILRRR